MKRSWIGFCCDTLASILYSALRVFGWANKSCSFKSNIDWGYIVASWAVRGFVVLIEGGFGIWITERAGGGGRLRIGGGALGD